MNNFVSSAQTVVGRETHAREEVIFCVFAINRLPACKYTTRGYPLSRVLKDFYFPDSQIDTKDVLTNQG